MMKNKKKRYTEDSSYPFFNRFSQFMMYSNTPVRGSSRIAGIYIILGVLWILLSDKIVEFFVQDRQWITTIGLIKGWLFVLASGAVIFGLVYYALKRVNNDEVKIDSSYRQLSATHEELEATYEELTAQEEELRQQYETLMENQQLLIDSEERYRLISEAGNDGIWDERDGIRYFSDRWLQITGYSREELEKLGDWKALVHPEDSKLVASVLQVYKENRAPYFASEFRLRHKNGHYLWIQARGKANFDILGNVTRMSGSHTDITELKEYQQKLKYLAYHDQLTGLSNRLALNEEKAESILSSELQNFSLMFIDIDNFKFINDTLGHNFGDQLIRLFGERLVSHLQGAGSVYRQGGDEFVVVFDSVPDTREINRYADQILASVIEPLIINNSSLYINISIGISNYPEHGSNINELLRCADIAMYKAKEKGGNCHIIYRNEMNESITERMIIHKNLHDALENNELELYYQPQYDLKEQRYTGIEALLRWNSKDMGLVPPLKFIGIAEETHLIVPIGTWVLKKACEFVKKLHDTGLADITVSVNVSILQLLQNDIVEIVFQTLEEYHLEPQSLELEITETVLMESYDAIKEKLNIFVNKGIKIALDDFGKGYSSLNYLKLLPITTLKIDKSFIDSISLENGSKSLTSNIIGIGRCMNLNIVAEGVETKEQLDYLTANDCDKVQGYWFSRPVPEPEIEKLFAGL